jgi:tRNA U34 5-carboxymethylaminomethyl modifying enzyme MnmG/GidA
LSKRSSTSDQAQAIKQGIKQAIEQAIEHKRSSTSDRAQAIKQAIKQAIEYKRSSKRSSTSDQASDRASPPKIRQARRTTRWSPATIYYLASRFFPLRTEP